MFCENCGKEIKDENKFCPYCGASVQPEQNGEQPEQSAQPEQKSEQPEQSAQPEQKSEQPKQSAQSEQKSKQPKQYVQSEQRLTQKETTGNSSADVKNKGVSHPAPKKKKTAVVIGIIAMAAVIIIGIIAAVKMFGSSDAKETAKDCYGYPRRYGVRRSDCCGRKQDEGRKFCGEIYGSNEKSA